MPSALRKLYAALFLGLLLVLAFPVHAGDSSEFFPLSDVKPGMKGVVYTIYQGDEIEKIDLVVLGVIQNAIGPKEDIILVQLLGEKAEHSGVVAGMSGSPVYFDGKLAGALSLKLGLFTKEAIGGVTPIANMLDVEKSNPQAPSSTTKTSAPNAATEYPLAYSSRIDLPDQLARSVGVGGGQCLVPIDTPMISSGLYPETIAQFSKQFSAWGVSLAAGGAAPASPDDANLQPGDMVGMELVRGDLSISPGCTVTRVDAGRVYACGHPVFFVRIDRHAHGARPRDHHAQFGDGLYQNHVHRRDHRNVHTGSPHRDHGTTRRRPSHDSGRRHAADSDHRKEVSL